MLLIPLLFILFLTLFIISLFSSLLNYLYKKSIISIFKIIIKNKKITFITLMSSSPTSIASSVLKLVAIYFLMIIASTNKTTMTNLLTISSWMIAKTIWTDQKLWTIIFLMPNLITLITLLLIINKVSPIILFLFLIINQYELNLFLFFISLNFHFLLITFFFCESSLWVFNVQNPFQNILCLCYMKVASIPLLTKSVVYLQLLIEQRNTIIQTHYDFFIFLITFYNSNELQKNDPCKHYSSHVFVLKLSCNHRIQPYIHSIWCILISHVGARYFNKTICSWMPNPFYLNQIIKTTCRLNTFNNN